MICFCDPQKEPNVGRREKKRATWLLDFRQYKNYLRQEGSGKFLTRKQPEKHWHQKHYLLHILQNGSLLSKWAPSSWNEIQFVARQVWEVGQAGTRRRKEKPSSFWCKKSEAVLYFEKYFKIYHTKANFEQQITKKFITQLIG